MDSDVGADTARDSRFLELSREFPLAPIRDDGDYRKAIAILDALFVRDDERTEGDLEYFRCLARIVAHYEEAVGMWSAH
jgi:hypothetical protein